jgi:hypothetical protein
MVFSLFSKKSAAREKDRELSLIIDIESGLVRGSLISFSKTPIVIYSVSSPIMASHAGKSRLLSAMVAAVGRIGDKVLREGLSAASTSRVSKIHCAFSSPWIISKTKTVKIHYERETEITKTAVTAILDGERRGIEESFLNDHPGTSAADLAFIEQKIFEIKLNGYPVSDFQGKKARDLEVSFAVSVSSKNILEHIEKAVERSIRVHRIEYHSSLLLQYAAFRNLMSTRNSYIAAHIHNEISDIIVVKNGVCSAMASFPLGTKAFAQKSAAALGQPDDVTQSLLSLRTKNALNSLESEKINSIIDPVIREWAERFMQTLAVVGDTDSMPRQLYLATHEHYPYFERAILDQTADRAVPLDITPIDEVLLEKAVSFERSQDRNALVSMYAFALN